MVARASMIELSHGTAKLLLAFAVLAAAGSGARAGTRFSEPGIFDADKTGSASQSALVVGADGAMYGTTEFGGRHGLGTVFRFVEGLGIEAVHHFDGKQGARPRAGLLRLPDGSLWGVAGFGGAHDLGSVFCLTPSGKVKLVHSFDGVDGEYPLARLTLGRDGLVYGSTAGMTDAYAGSVFRVDPADGRFTLLHRFEGDKLSAPLGHSPTGRLLQAADGYFYGTTYEGGTKGQGTVYRLDPASGAVALVHAFQQGEGCKPYAGLPWGQMLEHQGALWGTLALGVYTEYSAGTIYKLTTTAHQP